MIKSQMKISAWIMLIIGSTMTGCNQTPKDQIVQAMEFYYPTGGVNQETTYEIMHDWGTYVITTGAGPNAKLSTEREPYRGYITIRAIKADSTSQENFPSYLITPSGEAWTCEAICSDVPQTKEREEITTEESEYGVVTSSTFISSSLEPIVDHFKSTPGAWKRYGKLETNGDNNSVLTKF
jgi:hypothetical protein